MANNYRSGCDAWPITEEEAKVLGELLEEENQTWRVDFGTDDDFGQGFEAEISENHWSDSKEKFPKLLIISDDGEYLHSENLANFLEEFLKRCRPKGAIGVCWADTCSKRRIGEFGGGAFVVFGDGSDQQWLDLGQWIYDHTRKYE